MEAAEEQQQLELIKAKIGGSIQVDDLASLANLIQFGCAVQVKENSLDCVGDILVNCSRTSNDVSPQVFLVCMHALVYSFQHGESESIKESASYCLATLSCFDEHLRGMFAFPNFVMHLVTHLQKHSDQDVGKRATTVNSVACLVNLTLEDRNMNGLFTFPNLVCTLVDNLTSIDRRGSMKLVEHACNCLANMACDELNRIAMVKNSNIVARLTDCILLDLGDNVIKQAVRCLANMSCGSGNGDIEVCKKRTIFLAPNCMLALCRYVSPLRNTDTHREASIFVAHLLAIEDNAFDMMMLPKLSSLLVASTNHGADAERVVRIFYGMSLYFQQELAGDVQVFNFLKSNAGNDMYAAFALMNLTRNCITSLNPSLLREIKEMCQTFVVRASEQPPQQNDMRANDLFSFPFALRYMCACKDTRDVLGREFYASLLEIATFALDTMNNPSILETALVCLVQFTQDQEDAMHWITCERTHKRVWNLFNLTRARHADWKMVFRI
jgi:hypothetical protein